VLGSDTPDVVDALAREGLPAEAVPDWATLRARIIGGQRYDDVLLPLREPDRAGGDVVSTAHECASTALGAARHWLGDECFAPTRLVVVTRGVEQVRPGDGNPPLAAALGLLRSAQTENPGRVLLLDLDNQRDVPWRTLLRPADEPRMAVRDGQVLVPRLVPASAGPPPTEKAAFNGLVVVVGGTGAVGRVVSRHLVRRYGVRYLLLLGRRGAGAPEADRLHTELTELGVDVTIRACDAADRDALAAVLDEARQRAPLSAVFHLGGVIDDGVLPSLTPERLDRVLRPKVDAAWHLHELTRTDDLAAFVLFSSVSGVLGNAGQGSYAAANAFLDALAGYRRGLGLPGTALAWGMWAERAGMTRDLSDADLHRIRRTGIAPLASPDALALLDAALTATEPVLVPAALSLDTLRRQGGRVPGLLRALVDPVGTPAVEPAARRESPLDLVRDSAAAVLGHGQAADVPLDMSFRDLGFDSLMTVELRNRLAEATGLRLAAGITVEHPTPRRLAEHLTALAGQTTAAAPAPVQPSTLVDLFARACATGSVADGMAMLGTAARLRETFEQPPEQWRANAVRSLARGADHPVLICIPSYTAVSGPHEYEQFAASLDGGRDVLAVALPGFSAGEPLPASIPALVSALTAVVADAIAGRPFVLLGRSSGGWLANAVAERMGGTGQLAGLVLVDTFPPAEGQARLPTLMRRIMAYGPENAVLHDAAVTAMGHYFHLFAQWRPAAVDAPTLLVRATEPYDPSLSPASTDWRASWVFPHEVRDIAGDHFTILEQAAAQTAAAVHDWLREIG
jgi:thioesterase domain-containing protein